MRLLFVTREDFPTFRVDVDILFARELAARGHQIDFVMQAASANIRQGRQPWHGAQVLVGPAGRLPGLAGRVDRQLRCFGHEVRCLLGASRRRYDAIQVRDKFFIAVIALLIARLRGLKFFYWLSFPFPEDDQLRAREGNSRFDLLVALRGRVSAWLLYKVLLPKSDHSFVQSQRMKDEVCGRGAIAAHTTPVPMGIELAALGSPDAAGSVMQSPRREITYLGTLDANRELGILIEMLRQLVDAGVDVRLVLIGDAAVRADRDALIEYARRLGVESRLEITGQLPRAEALQRARGAAIALSPIAPSPVFRVGSPTKLVEYLGLGIPVVANNHPEQKTILRDCRAGVCVPWSAKQFARGVRWMLGVDTERRADMIRRGREWVRKHRTYEQLAAQLHEKYQQLMHEGATVGTRA